MSPFRRNKVKVVKVGVTVVVIVVVVLPTFLRLTFPLRSPPKRAEGRTRTARYGGGGGVDGSGTGGFSGGGGGYRTYPLPFLSRPPQPSHPIQPQLPLVHSQLPFVGPQLPIVQPHLPLVHPQDSPGQPHLSPGHLQPVVNQNHNKHQLLDQFDLKRFDRSINQPDSFFYHDYQDNQRVENDPTSLSEAPYEPGEVRAPNLFHAAPNLFQAAPKDSRSAPKESIVAPPELISASSYQNGLLLSPRQPFYNLDQHPFTPLPRDGQNQSQNQTKDISKDILKNGSKDILDNT